MAFLVFTLISLIIFIVAFQLLIDFIKNDSLNEALEKIRLQENTQLVMENLDEAIFSFSSKGLNYINNKAFEIIDEV